MSHAWLAALAAALSLPAMAGAGVETDRITRPKSEPTMVVNGATVLATKIQTVNSGYLKFWDRFTVKTAAGEVLDIFALHMSSDDPQPEVGQVCDFDYRVQYGEGVGADRPPASGRGAMRFSCNGGEWKFR